VKGKITVNNYVQKEITLKVTKHLNGELVLVSNDGKAVKTGRYLGRNVISKGEWNLTLKPNQQQVLTYDYKVILDN
jgi:hypothetical protein